LPFPPKPLRSLSTMVPSLRLGLLVYVSIVVLFTSPRAGAELISVGQNGAPAGVNSRQPSMSADGRYVAFAAIARLTADDTNAISDVYVRDRVTKTTRRVSDDRGGDQPAISANGRFVAFRALDDLTRIRVVDLQQSDRRVSAAIPTDVTNYDRP